MPLGDAMASVGEGIGGRLAEQLHDMRSGGGKGGATSGGDGEWLEISPDAAVPIPRIARPRRIAYVDGGNATLVGTPGWSVGFNRVYYALCRGEEVLHPSCMPRVDFLSLLDAAPDTGSGNGGAAGGGSGAPPSRPRRYALRTFPIRPTRPQDRHVADDTGTPRPLPPLDAFVVPTDADLDAGGSGEADNGGDDDDNAAGGGDDNGGPSPDSSSPSSDRATTDHNRSRMMSVPRAFAEWKMAAAVVERELEKGDMLVMDGTLQTGYGGEARLAAALYDRARRRGVVVCAMAKTTTLMTAAGVPVLYAAQEAARGTGHHAWYMPLARRVSGDGSGFMLAVRLHRHSRYTFRFEVLRDQYEKMDAGTIGEVIASLAANSGDPSFPGYPYGLVAADRHARVRGEEAALHRNVLLGAFRNHDLGRAMVEHTNLLSAHKTLNRAVGG